MGRLRVNEGPGCSKIVLIVINGIFVLLGLAVLALGIYVRVDPTYSKISDTLDLNPDKAAHKVGNKLLNLQTASIAIIILGAVISGVSIIGILGACFESKVLVVIYGIIITVVLLGLISIGVTALIYKYAFNKDFEKDYREILKSSIEKYYQGEVQNKTAFTISIDTFQIFFECCGVNNYKDFEGAKNWNRSVPGGTAKAPISCCKFTKEQRKAVIGTFPKLDNYQCAINPTVDNSNFEIGCLTELNKYSNKILGAIILITILTGLILIIGTISACVMCRSI